jgi:hypothetical protein
MPSLEAMKAPHRPFAGGDAVVGREAAKTQPKQIFLADRDASNGWRLQAACKAPGFLAFDLNPSSLQASNGGLLM